MNTFVVILFIITLILLIYISYMYSKTPSKPKKVIVFDMDETLGSFVQLGIFIHILEEHIHRTVTSQEFNLFMDMFPLYQRPNIINILKYLKKEKQQGHCDKIYIYTNNQGPKSWALLIKQYFEDKINYPLFDKVIHAYKVNNVQVEKHRTTHNKTISDFFKCTKLSKYTNICFLDDQYHHHMLHPNVYYLHLNEYKHLYDPNYMFDSFKQSFDLSDTYISYLKHNAESLYLDIDLYTNKHNTNKVYEKQIGSKMLHELKYFITSFNKPSTRKIKHKQQYTRKNGHRYPYKHIH